jgi:hypothetical protein
MWLIIFRKSLIFKLISPILEWITVLWLRHVSNRPHKLNWFLKFVKTLKYLINKKNFKSKIQARFFLQILKNCGLCWLFLISFKTTRLYASCQRKHFCFDNQLEKTVNTILSEFLKENFACFSTASLLIVLTLKCIFPLPNVRFTF